MKATENQEAIALADAIKLVNELRIPVMSRDERIGLKERAKLTRKLFKDLGLKGISVRVPTGANCFFVMIGLPAMDHDANHHRSDPNCPGCVYRAKLHLSIEEILQRAFPKEVDKSDPQSDYFDYPWSIGFQRPEY